MRITMNTTLSLTISASALVLASAMHEFSQDSSSTKQPQEAASTTMRPIPSGQRQKNSEALW
jgi:hypothetical protein